MAVSILGPDGSLLPYGQGSAMSILGPDGAYLPYNGITEYLGQVATSTTIMGSLSVGNKQMMTRSPHWARDNLNSFQLVYANWYMVGATPIETAHTAPLTVEASIEYPQGTYTRVRFNGQDQGVIPEGENIVSDEIFLSIPYGAKFWVRTWISCTAGIIYNNFAAGENLSNYAATTPNYVMTDGTIGSQAQAYTPVAIIGMTSRPSIAIIGDSRTLGTADTRDGTLHRGPYARSVGPGLGYINMGVNGGRLSSTLTDLGRRVALSNYCSHIICALGYNDLASDGVAAATVHTDLQTLYALFPVNKPIWQATIEPGMVTTTDAYATEANQTINAAVNTRRVSFNDTLRGGIPGIQGVLDVASPVESLTTSGKWQPNLTADGTHANRTGILKQQSQAGIHPGLFVR